MGDIMLSPISCKSLLVSNAEEKVDFDAYVLS